MMKQRSLQSIPKKKIPEIKKTWGKICLMEKEMEKEDKRKTSENICHQEDLEGFEKRSCDRRVINKEH